MSFSPDNDATTLAAKRLLVSGDRMLLERRAQDSRRLRPADRRVRPRPRLVRHAHRARRHVGGAGPGDRRRPRAWVEPWRSRP